MSHPAYQRRYDLRCCAKLEMAWALKHFSRSQAIAVVFGNFADAMTFDDVVSLAREVRPT